jgi:hypothetical protein
MKKSLLIKSIVCATLALALVGCSSTKKIGTIAGVDFYKVHAGNFDGPNYTALVTVNTNGTDLKVHQVFGSSGIGSSIIVAGGHAGAAALLGTSFPKNVSDNVNVSGGNSSATGGTGNATGGNSSATGGTTSSTSTSTSTSSPTVNSSLNNNQTGGTFVPPGQQR